jgi:uroporphyrinogen-III synthase
MRELIGRKIALLEARMSGELANLVKRHGGEPINAPALREVAIDARDEVATFLDELKSGEIKFVVFQTGVAVAGLITEAEKLERKAELLNALRKVTTICRGPKPTAVLSRNGIKPSVNAEEPYTTADLITAMNDLDLKNQGVAVLHYGERNLELAKSLEARGAKLLELCLYEWQLPENIEPLKSLIHELNHERIDAVAFTSQIQARHLFQIAKDLNCEEELLNSLNSKTVVASIGPTCTAALLQLGVTPKIEPKHPKMGPMVIQLMKYFE